MPRGKMDPDHGAYLPSPEEIARLCEQFRTRGYRDAAGKWHAPWRANRYPARVPVEVPEAGSDFFG